MLKALFATFLLISLVCLHVTTAKVLVKRQFLVNPIQAARNQQLRTQVARLRGQLQGRNDAFRQIAASQQRGVGRQGAWGGARGGGGNPGWGGNQGGWGNPGWGNPGWGGNQLANPSWGGFG